MTLTKPSLQSLLTNDKIGFALIILLAIFSPTAKAAANLSAALLLICYLSAFQWQMMRESLKNPMVSGCLLWLGLLLIGCLYSPHPMKSLHNLIGLNWLIYPLLMYPYLRHNTYRVKCCLLAILASFVFLMLTSYFNLLFMQTAHFFEFGGEGIYPLSTQHFAFPVALMYLIFGGYIFYQRSYPTWLKASLIGMIVLALVAEYGINTSRAGYLIELVILITLFASKWRLKGLAVFFVLAFTGLMLAYSLSNTFHQRINLAASNVTEYFGADHHHVDGNQLKEAAQTSWGSRMFNIEYSGHILQQSSLLRLIFGYGTNAYATVFSQQLAAEPSTSKYYQVMPDAIEPDNNYLRMLFENGILGIVFMLGLLGYFASRIKEIPMPYRDFAKVGLIIFFMMSAFINPFTATLIRCMMLPLFLSFMLYKNNNRIDK